MGSDSDKLAKNGLWNDDAAKQWRADADFFATEANWYQIYRPGGDFDFTPFEESQTAPTNPCDPYSYLLVYRRKP